MKELAVVQYLHDEVDKHLTLVFAVFETDFGRIGRVHGYGLGRDHVEVVDHSLCECVFYAAVIVDWLDFTLAKYILRLKS